MLYDVFSWILYKSFEVFFKIIEIYLKLLDQHPIATIIITVTIYRKWF